MNDKLIQKGWECPKCGRVYSPTTEMCRYCGNEEITVTTNLANLDDSPCRDCGGMSVDCINSPCGTFDKYVKSKQKSIS